MNADELLRHYERIADAPDAVARLRRFVLDLAVRGKLVPRDSRDESASELLKKIAAVKAKASGDRQQKAVVIKAATPKSWSFEPPDGWVWVLFGDVVMSRDGERVPVSRDDRNARAKLFDYYGASGVIDKIDGYLFEKPLLLIGEDGANLVNRSTPIAFIARGKYWVNNHAHVLDAVSEELLRYLELFINATDLAPYITGTAQPKMNQAKMNSIPVALPPLAEQGRIVAKVDELMALCDRLEATRAQREAARDRLARSCLARLDTPDPETFREDARFALDALPALSARPDQIKKLRQTILSLAVRGKLVPQDTKDEPIAAALRVAFERRASLVRARKARWKKVDDIAPLAQGDDLPGGWLSERLGNLVDPENTISYGVLVPGGEFSTGVPFVRVQDLSLKDHPERPNKTIDPEIEKAYARTRLRGGEILLCVVGSIGKIGLAPNSWAGANIARAVARIRPLQELSRDYLLLVLQAPPAQAFFVNATRTLAQPTLNVALIEETPVPLPPLVEQHRIVAKVDQLMSLCDRLEASLTQANDQRCCLLESLLHKALEPAAELEEQAA